MAALTLASPAPSPAQPAAEPAELSAAPAELPSVAPAAATREDCL